MNVEGKGGRSGNLYSGSFVDDDGERKRANKKQVREKRERERVMWSKVGEARIISIM
jgi:hypothetical protein